MKKQFDNTGLFLDSGCLSRYALDSYRRGSLSGPDQHRVERHTGECSLCESALAGFLIAKDPGRSDRDIRRKIRSRYSSGNTNLFRYSGIGLGIVVTALIAYLAMEKKEMNHLIAENPVPREAIVQNSVVESDPVSETVTAQDGQDNAPETPAKQSPGQKENFIQSLPAPIQPSRENNLPASTPAQSANEPLPPARDPAATENKPSQKKPVKESAAKIAYLEGYKTVAFEELHKVKKKFPFSDNHVPPSYSNRDQQQATVNDPDQTVKTVSYESVLESGIRKYKSGSYLRALEEFSLVFSNYPDDLNAHFYSALCYHALGKYDKAIAGFDRAIKHKVPSFYEEAKWYKALSLTGNKNIEEAKGLLQEIISENGFYAEQAGEKLKGL